jgi:threonine dehydrogenase-like Zn-dependent dehydrogenase
VPFNIACGQCHFCKQGLFGNCHESNPQATAVGAIYGYSHTAGGYDGGQAQYARVPYADFGPQVIPDWMDPDDAVLLTDVVPTGYQAAEMGGIQRGDTVVVSAPARSGSWRRAAPGCSARAASSSSTISTTGSSSRGPIARRRSTISASWTTVVLFMKKTTDGLGADVAIEAVGGDAVGNALQTLFGNKLKLEAGNAIPLHWAINSVKKGGVVSIVGVYGPTGNMVPIGNVVNKG